MKQTKLSGYQPAYPKKVIRGAVLATAAIVALGASTGCKLIPGTGTDLSGMVPIEEPTPEELVLDGEVAIDPGAEEATPEPMPEEVTLSGDVAIDDTQP